MSLGEHLRALRREKKLTQREVALAAGIDVTYLSKIENGRLEHSPSLKTLQDLAKALGVDELELMHLADKVPTVLGPIAGDKEALEFFRQATQTVRSPEQWKALLSYLEPIESGVGGEATAAFSPGDQVVYRPTGAPCIVVGPPPGGGTEYVRIVLEGQLVTVRGAELVLQQDPLRDLVSRLCRGAATDATGIRLLLTLLRLSRPLYGTLYSYRASRTVFSPHQFKPLLKILAAPSPRLLVADEVGVGKTIEAALTLLELQARQFFLPEEINIILCPAALVDKWRDELEGRFDLEVKPIDVGEVRNWVRRIEDSGRLTYGDLLCIGSLQAWRSDEVQAYLRQALELGLRIGLLIVDEVHHARNAGTKTHALVDTLASEARAVVFLSATPLHLGHRDLFNLLSLLDPELFPDFATFGAVLEPIKVLNRASRLLEAGGVEARRLAEVELSLLPGMDPNGLVVRDPRWPLVQKMLREEDGWGLERAVATRDLLLEISPLAHSFTRTRKKDVIIPSPIREASPAVVDFTLDQLAFYEEGTRILLERACGDASPGFLEVMLQRRMSSCLPAFIQSLEDALAAGSIRDFEAASENEDLTGELPDDAPGSLGIGSYTANLKELLRLGRKIAGVPDPKLHALLRVLDGVMTGGVGQCVVFAFFIGTLNYLEHELRTRGFRVGVIHGGVHPTQDEPARPSRRTVIREFWAGNIDVLLSSEVGGEGLDFQCANAVVNYDLPWNPMRVEQRIGRVDRFGQTSEKILIFNLLVRQTIEERVLARLYDRLGVFHESVGALEPVLGDGLVGWDKMVVRLSLSPEQIDEAERRLINARQRRVEDLLRFEELRNELAMDDVFTERVIRAHDEGDLIEPSDLADLYEAAIATVFPSSRLTKIGPDRVSIEVGPDLRTSISKTLAPTATKGIDPRRLQTLRRALLPLATQPKVTATFDASTAAPGERVEVFSALHPLSKLMADALLPAGHLPAARVQLSGINEAHAVGLYLLDIRGPQTSTRLIPAAAYRTEHGWEPLAEDGAAELLQQLSKHGTPTSEPISEGDANKALAAVDVALLPVRAKLEADLSERAVATTEQRLRSHDMMVEKQRARLQNLIARLKAESKTKGARLNEQNLAAFLRRQEALRFEIDQGRHVSVAHSLAGLIWVNPA